VAAILKNILIFWPSKKISNDFGHDLVKMKNFFRNKFFFTNFLLYFQHFLF